MLDIVVIGAGAAGLAAARRVMERGMRVPSLSLSRRGGRTEEKEFTRVRRDVG